MTRKPRTKRDGSVERIKDCPLCGSRDNWEINSLTGLFHCWACGYGGRIPPSNTSPNYPHELVNQPLRGVRLGPAVLDTVTSSPAVAPSEGGRRDPDSSVGSAGLGPASPPSSSGETPEKPKRPEPSKEIPRWVQKIWGERGLVPEAVLRLEPLWDGSRLLFPVDGGPAWTREVIPGVEPKVRSFFPKGLLGLGRLPAEASLVLVEGDYKAAAIPLPFRAVALGGKTLSAYQQGLLLTKAPFESVRVCLDGGEDEASNALRLELLGLGIKALVCRLPEGCGPDDVPRAVLVRSLLEAS